MIIIVQDDVLMTPIIIITVLQTKAIICEGEGLVSTINSNDFNNESPHMSIQVPCELIRRFAGNETCCVPTISFLFYEVEHLFPNETAGRNK